MARFLGSNAVIEKINDPYIGAAGGAVYGNVLDTFSNPTYNIRLYMMNDTLTKNAKDEMSSPDPSLAPENPGDMVILAQTGVTAGNIIDNVEIVTLSNANGPNATSIDFDITQPGSATFIDEMKLAMHYLGMKPNVTPQLFLEIRFQGYSGPSLGDGGDVGEDEGGAPEVIAGPYRYKLALRNFTVAIDEGGSKYGFSCASLQSFAFRRAVYKTPIEIATSGKTIKEHIASLEESLNNHYKELADTKVPDQYEFDLSKLINDPEAEDDFMTIKDDKLLTSDSQDAERMNRQMSELASVADAIERDAAITANPQIKNDGSPEKIIEGDKITFPIGTTFDQILATLLSMNDEFYTKITRRDDIEDPGSESKPSQGFVSWYKLNAKTEIIDFDSSRNTYAYKYKYQPVLYKSTRTDIAVKEDEQVLAEDDANTRLGQIVASGSVKKSYNYIFTGLNDQILNLDIKYDSGVALLLAPGGGSVGSFSVAESDKLTQTIPADKATDVASQVEKEKETKKELDLGKIKSFFNDIKDTINDGISTVNTAVGRLADLTGTAEEDVRAILTQPDGDEALEELIGGIDSGTVSDLAGSLGYDRVIEPNPIEVYEPGVSPYIYSTDLVLAQDGSLTGDQLTELGYTKVDVGEALKDVQTKSTNVSSNPVKESTYKSNSVRNTLFGNIVEQHMQDRSFLLLCDMEIRGDPWYLGAPGLQASDEESADWYHNDNHFFLRIKAPEKFDPDWRDEDANSGYWKYDGESRTFSGLYRYIKCTNRFSGGAYTIDLTGNRIIGSALLTKKKTTVEEVDEVEEVNDGIQFVPPGTPGTGT